MKKLLSLIIVSLLIFTSAYAEVNLSDFSFEELLELQKQVNSEIISRPEWKEVKVPSGTWIVGEDIPAGFYSISPKELGAYLRIRDAKGKIAISGGIRHDEDLIAKYELKEGYTVEIEDGALYFAPAQSLGFF